MSLSVYLGHSVAEAEMSVLWELQASAVAHGIRAHLASYRPVGTLTSSRKAQIDQSDAFIAIATRPSRYLEEEISYAVGQVIPAVVFSLPGVDITVPKGATHIPLPPRTTAADLLSDISRRIRGTRLPKDLESKEALTALIGLGALLFVLFALTKD